MLISLVLALFAASPYRPVFDTNPYCHMSIPAISCQECPPPKIADPTCQANCLTTYNTAMRTYILAACAGWDGAESTYNACTRVAGDNYTSCIATATTQAQIDACNNTYFNAMQTCATNLQNSLDFVDSYFQYQKAIAVTNFNDCCMACCHNP
jgi:hypothetical protein